jgi:hypothetical protein
MPPDLEDKLPDGRDADRRGPVDPGRSGPRTDARPGSPSGLRRPRAGSHARERRGGPGGAVPAHRNAGACSWPAVRPRIARRSRWVIRTVRETRALPPLCALIAANGLAVQGTPEWSFCVPEADTHRGNAAWSSRPRVLAATPAGPDPLRGAGPRGRLPAARGTWPPQGPVRPGEPFPHELQRLRSPGPPPFHALIPCATAMWW